MDFTKTTSRTHIKDKKITIMTYTDTKDECGFTIQEFIPLPSGENIWAYYRHTKASEFYAAATLNTKIECVFEINWRDDINTAMRIKYKDELYEISQIDDYEGYKGTLRIYAYKIN
ncbi:putative phage head-tail adaptor [Clostridium botulinum C str. Eklund]|nr:putative phage head-tail adaptor [Clostridium botulinum C str. Eklund]NEZ49317.1 head-tail adaptor protein [Clostridium botulinum]